MTRRHMTESDWQAIARVMAAIHGRQAAARAARLEREHEQERQQADAAAETGDRDAG